ncbi:UDP-N-acetylmuramoylalanine--D-glutamate ligase [Bacteroidia bacterium]|nr:UDP-N-acetylmuramoylalanine--D-glutamate ligase [Bacteroidia bacterium]
MDFSNKKIVILGFGREGQSSYKYLRNILGDSLLTIADVNENVKNNDLLSNDEHLNFILGENYLDKVSDFDVIIKSPGISLKNHQSLKNSGKITSQSDIFLQKYSSQIIGITGTKGKSTTSSLIYHIIKKHTDNVLLVGNIGLPPLDFVDKIDNKTHIVYELSSHQLEFIQKSPHIAILLNIFQEHLDHYNSYEDYQAAKWNITDKQTENDIFIMNADEDLLNMWWIKANITRRLLTVSLFKNNKNCFVENNKIFFSNEFIYDLNDKRNLPGNHNIYNIMTAICACKSIDIPNKIIVNAINDFKPLPHRIEYVGNFKGIDFYNDSISTIPEAAIAAIKTVKNVETLILGGFDRGIDYSILIDYLYENPVKNVIFIGNAGKRMRNIWVEKIIAENMFSMQKNDTTDDIKNSVNFFDANNYEVVVALAYKHTAAGKSCLLSPAAASYDMFKNFEERGNFFKQQISLQLT